jgi:formate dehydrogenase iron-sulfur subunit
MSKKGRSAMNLSRRDFLKFSVPATTGLVVASTAGSSLVAAAATPDPNLTGWALLYNTLLCQGPSCRACTNGCRDWNVLDKNPARKPTEVEPLETRTWTSINDKRDQNPDGTPGAHHFFKAQCRHCTNASCVSACPTGAMAYHGDYTVPDQGWCIGCGYCAQACPFGVPQLGEPKHTSTKCRFCYNLLSSTNPDPNFLDPDTLTGALKGKTTACALRCPVRPVKALRFGKRADLIATAQQEIADIKAGKNPYLDGKPPLATNRMVNSGITAPPPDLHLYGDSADISGGSHVLFILAEKNSFYGLPDQPGLSPEKMFPDKASYAAAKVPASWGAGVATSAALAILPFWLLFRRKQQLEAGQKSGVQGGAK